MIAGDFLKGLHTLMPPVRISSPLLTVLQCNSILTLL